MFLQPGFWKTSSLLIWTRSDQIPNQTKGHMGQSTHVPELALIAPSEWIGAGDGTAPLPPEDAAGVRLQHRLLDADVQLEGLLGDRPQLVGARPQRLARAVGGQVEVEEARGAADVEQLGLGRRLLVLEGAQ